jgi:hypothetical protein
MKTLERWIVGLLTTFVLLVTAVAVGGTARAWAMQSPPPAPATQTDVAASQSSGSTALVTILIIAIWLAWCVVLLASVKGGRFLIKRIAR